MNKTIPRIEVNEGYIEIYHIEHNPTFSYDIRLEDFKARKEFWLSHLKEKNWFTEDMENTLKNL
jgi:hypothetical protein